ncbi:MAG: Flp pilus assembly complex ATPase component TadA [Bacteriovoracaceae bacterium]|nr:Flp pilus assembly complex ATPase component TadA [Bacteriovoracaceae bacterium]
MNNIYSEKIESEYKSIFQESLNCGKLETRDQLLKKTLFKLGLEQLENEVNIQRPLYKWYSDVVELKFLNSFLEQEKLEELIIHSSENLQIIGGSAAHSEKLSIDQLDLTTALKVISFKAEVCWNYSTPFASFGTNIKMMNYRVTLIDGSITENGIPKAFFRRLKKRCFPLSSFCTPKIEEVLKDLVKSKANTIVAGATCSGKTSLTTSLLGLISPDEHLVVLEDANEISLNHPNTTKLISTPKDGKELIDYMGYSMRMSPDRIILGEMRSKEVVPFILAMNTGHKGLITTIHANSASDTIDRIAMLFSVYGGNGEINYEMIKKLIVKNIDAIIYIENKQIKEIVRPIGMDGTTPIYTELTPVDEIRNNTYHCLN